jgi:hypothetical protein
LRPASRPARTLSSRYERYWQAALDAGADMVSITSFNEWGEGTQVEAARRHVDPATGQELANYGGELLWWGHRGRCSSVRMRPCCLPAVRMQGRNALKHGGPCAADGADDSYKYMHITAEKAVLFQQQLAERWRAAGGDQPEEKDEL